MLGRLLRFSLPALLTITLLRCGSKGPSHILGLENLPPEQQELLKKAVDEFNTRSGKQLLAFEDSGGLPIHVEKTPSADIEGIEPSQPLRLGYAVLSASDCKIQISEKIFKSDTKEYYTLVQWHEFGHCFGLGHEPDPKAIMHTTNHPLNFYSPEAVQSFFHRLIGSVDLR